MDQKLKRWMRSRYGWALFLFFSLLAAQTLLRVGLFLKFGPSHQNFTGAFALVAGIGLARDCFVALLLTLPVLVWFWIVPDRWFSAKFHRVLFFTAAVFFWLVQLFLFAVEYFFFEEFMARFNTVAVDYLLYPHEVFINIWDSYPVGSVLIGCLVLAAAWSWLARRLAKNLWTENFPRRIRAVPLVASVALLAFLQTFIHLKAPAVSEDRVVNEIANNGTLSFVAAFWTRHLDFAAFYKTLPRDEAYRRARRLLNSPGDAFVGTGESLRRRIHGNPAQPRLNVVILLEESLGSEFWGSLGRKGASLTPELDRLAEREGILFTNIFASGNRTVRGMEGVLASFPPLPGDAIVKRDQSDNVETIARVLKRDGYNTLFLYGGRGIFDGMRSFTTRNGYDRFIEQKDFGHPTFTTIWGVCDEDLYARSIEEFRELAKSGQPFLGTILSVSNHKPYTYPAGRIAENPNKHRRAHAVKYADYSLGRFFEAARREAFWTNTIFVVVADHGARVYGSQAIPIQSYEIPLLILGPAAVSKPTRIGALGCSLDVAPTILGLIGRPYETMFFGRDLFEPGPGRVLLNHNRDIGLFDGETMAVLGLRKTVEFYKGDPRGAGLQRFSEAGGKEQELQQDAIALFQVADDLYRSGRYRVDAGSSDHALSGKRGGAGGGFARHSGK